MGNRRTRRQPQVDSSDELLKAYYQIMRELGPDQVLEQRIEREEHRLEEEHAVAQAG